MIEKQIKKINLSRLILNKPYSSSENELCVEILSNDSQIESKHDQCFCVRDFSLFDIKLQN